MAHTEKLSFDRPHSGRPPSHTICVYARAGLVHTSPQHNWSAYVFPRAGSLICKSKVHTLVLQYSSFNECCKRTRIMYLFSRCRYVLIPAAHSNRTVSILKHNGTAFLVYRQPQQETCLTEKDTRPVFGCRVLLLTITTEHEQNARHMRSLVKHMVLTTFHSVFPPLKGPRFGDARLQVRERR